MTYMSKPCRILSTVDTYDGGRIVTLEVQETMFKKIKVVVKNPLLKPGN